MACDRVADERHARGRPRRAADRGAGRGGRTASPGRCGRPAAGSPGAIRPPPRPSRRASPRGVCAVHCDGGGHLDSGRDAAVEHHVRRGVLDRHRHAELGGGVRPRAAGDASAERQHHPAAVARRSRTPAYRPRGSSASNSSVSGERPNSPSAPTGAGMIATSGMQLAADRRADAVGGDQHVALGGTSVGEAAARCHPARRRSPRPPPRSGRRPSRPAQEDLRGTSAGRWRRAAARRSSGGPMCGIVVSSRHAG